MSGLFAGLLLRQRGFDVDIYERVESELAGRGAGIVAQPAVADTLRGLGIDPVDLGVDADHAPGPRPRRPRRLLGAVPADSDLLGARLSHPARRLSQRRTTTAAWG